MCGFAGFLVAGADARQAGAAAVLTRMGSAMAARGPDDAGMWHDGDAGIGLAHRRLAVLDLSLALLVVGWFVLPAPNDRHHWACCGTGRRPWRRRNDKR